MKFSEFTDALCAFCNGNRLLRALMRISAMLLFLHPAVLLLGLIFPMEFPILQVLSSFFLPIGILLCLAERAYPMLLTAGALETGLHLAKLIRLLIAGSAVRPALAAALAALLFGYLTFLFLRLGGGNELLHAFFSGVSYNLAEIKHKQRQRRLRRKAEEMEAQRLEDAGVELGDGDCFCDQCGAALYPGYDRCIRCGAPVTQENDKPDESTAGSIICRRCGSVLAAGDSFCTHCGTPAPADFLASGAFQALNDESTRRYCIFCGQEIPRGDSFCTRCGKPVDSQASTEI